MQLYQLMLGCTSCWWYSNGQFTFEDFVGLLLMHEGSGDFLYSMLDAFAGAQQVYVGGGGGGSFGPYCPSGPCQNGVLNYFAAFSESARALVNTYVRGGVDITTYMGFGGRGITDPTRTMNDANFYGSTMLHPKPISFTSIRTGVSVTWSLDYNSNRGLSDYGSEETNLVRTLINNGLKPDTYYPGGNQGIYYFTTPNNGAAVWLSVDGTNFWLP